MYQSHSHQTAFCEIACLEFLLRFAGILISVKTGQNYKISSHYMCRPTCDYDLLSKLIFKIKAECLSCEIWAVSAKSWTSSMFDCNHQVLIWAINGTSPHLKHLKYLLCLLIRYREILSELKYSLLLWNQNLRLIYYESLSFEQHFDWIMQLKVKKPVYFPRIHTLLPD